MNIVWILGENYLECLGQQRRKSRLSSQAKMQSDTLPAASIALLDYQGKLYSFST